MALVAYRLHSKQKVKSCMDHQLEVGQLKRKLAELKADRDRSVAPNVKATIQDPIETWETTLSRVEETHSPDYEG